MENSPDDPSQAPDDFDRLLWQMTSGTDGDVAFKEPSAAERLRRPVQAAGAKRMSRRNARKAAQLRRPVPEPSTTRATGRRASSARRISTGSSRRRTRPLLIVVSVLVVLAGAGYALYALGPGMSSRDRGGPGNGLASHSGPAFTVADPFAGSPAEHFRPAPAGIVLPVGQPVGTFSAAQVTAAYATTKKLLIAASLDRQTLGGGRPESFALLLAPQLRSYFLNGLDRPGVDKQGYSRSTRSWIASFAPASTELVGTVIKVNGSMEAATATESGRHVLRIAFDYLFVYPVQRPGLPSSRMRVVVRQQGDVDFAQWNDPGGLLQAWFLPGPDSGPAGARCDVYDGFIHPEFPGGPPDRVHPSGAPVDPYSQAYVPSRAACQAISRT
jgi:hypothetical protein